MVDSVSSLSYFEKILSQSELALALSFKIQSSNIKCDIYMISIQAYLNSICVHEGLVLVLKSTRPRPEPSRPRPRPGPSRSRPRPSPELSRPIPRPQNRVSRPRHVSRLNIPGYYIGYQIFEKSVNSL